VQRLDVRLFVIIVTLTLAPVTGNCLFNNDGDAVNIAAVIQGIDDAKASQERNLPGYVRNENYAVFRGTDSEPAATMQVKVSYERGKGKEYKIESEKASWLMRTRVLDRFLDEQKKLSQIGVREDVLVSTKNYHFRYKQEIMLNGHLCYLFDISPKVKTWYLLDGQAWFEKGTFQLLQVIGRPAQSPSIWTGRPIITRTYTAFGEYFLASHLTAISHSILFGTTIVQIEYTDYQLKR
jgi:hypothetical protein